MISITHTARSKEWRYLRRPQIKKKIRELDGELWKEKHEDNRYHLRTPEVVLVFVVEEDDIVVVTQMSEHICYPENEMYRRLSKSEIGEIQEGLTQKLS